MPRAPSASAASDRAQRIFEEAASRDLHLALADLPAEFFDLEGAGVERDRDRVRCLRSVLMKPEHRAWIDAIWRILGESADAAGF
jgi:tyrosine decarboxylase/aspartate 1-decarboxylase